MFLIIVLGKATATVSAVERKTSLIKLKIGRKSRNTITAEKGLFDFKYQITHSCYSKTFLACKICLWLW